MKILKSKLSRIIIDATSNVNGVMDHRPGLLVELSADETQVVLYHFYYGRDGSIVCNQNVNVIMDNLDAVIDFLNEIKRKVK